MRIALLCLCTGMFGCGEDNGSAIDMTVDDLATASTDMAVGHCEPGPIGNFMTSFKPPTAAHQNRCTPTQINQGVAAIFANTFASFIAANGDCAACMVTPDNDAMLGPLVRIRALNIIDGNRDGCVAILTGDKSATSCAAKVQAEFSCITLSCDANCPIMSSADLADFNVCAGKATKTGAPCESYAAAATACLPNAMTDGGGSVVPDCFLGPRGAPAWFTYLSTLFCGA